MRHAYPLRGNEQVLLWVDRQSATGAVNSLIPLLLVNPVLFLVLSAVTAILFGAWLFSAVLRARRARRLGLEGDLQTGIPASRHLGISAPRALHRGGRTRGHG